MKLYFALPIQNSESGVWYTMIKNLTTVLTVSLLLSNNVTAKERPTPVQIRSDELVIQIDGIVCSFCANGVEKNLSKLTFIDSSRFGNGVLININTGRVTLALAKNIQPDLAGIYQAITEGGYTLNKVYFYLQGILERTNGNYTLQDRYTGKRYILHAIPTDIPTGKTVTINAHIDAKSLSALKPGRLAPLMVDELK